MSKTITREELLNLVEYDPETGHFYKKKPVEYNSGGYKNVLIKGKAYRAHRLAYFIIYNEWPPCLDHINRIKTDNRIENLRAVTGRQNAKNSDWHDLPRTERDKIQSANRKKRQELYKYRMKMGLIDNDF